MRQSEQGIAVVRPAHFSRQWLADVTMSVIHAFIAKGTTIV